MPGGEEAKIVQLYHIEGKSYEEIGTTLGIFDIPLLPCSGTFRLVAIRRETLELEAQNLQGDCKKADLETLELLPDGTLLYVSKWKGWETKGILQRAS